MPTIAQAMGVTNSALRAGTSSPLRMPKYASAAMQTAQTGWGVSGRERTWIYSVKLRMTSPPR